MWIWAAMFDLKAHVLHGKAFHALRGPVLIPIVAAVVVITAASFFLNAVFAYAITDPGGPRTRPARIQGRDTPAPLLLRSFSLLRRPRLLGDRRTPALRSNSYHRGCGHRLPRTHGNARP
jgi:hypothetical protein